jgi:diguanylate cyclase (GGDEF)-like protein/PAS domain S-box-containing protein
MKDSSKTNQELIAEIFVLKKRIQDLGKSESEHKRAEESLRKSEERYRTILEDIDEGYFEDDLAGNFTFVNDAECRYLGYSREELIGMNYRQYCDEATAKKSYDLFNNIYNTGKPIKRFPGQFISKDGTRHFNEVSASLIRDANGKPIGFRGISQDVTERKRAEEALRDAHWRLASIIEGTRVGTWEWNVKTGETVFNEVWAQIIGYTLDDLAPISIKTWETFAHPDDMKQSAELLERHFAGELPNYNCECRMKHKDGYWVWVLDRGRVITRTGDGKPLMMFGTHSDITERKRIEEELRKSEQRYRELSMIDELTQLYNSRHFYVQLKSETERSNRYGQPLTLLLLDLDNFKAFNDAYGHIEGDQVLSRLGQVVKRCLRETDSAYRYGGEEFTILLPMTTSGEGVVTAERIRTEFWKEAFSPVPGQDVHVTVSVGLAQYRTKEEMKAFVHRVDQLMYQGKKNGKDRVCSESSSQEQFKW